jgi:hypothetical protein
MEASQHTLFAACFTLHSINATLATVPQRGAGLWIQSYLAANQYTLVMSEPFICTYTKLDDRNSIRGKKLRLFCTRPRSKRVSRSFILIFNRYRRLFYRQSSKLITQLNLIPTVKGAFIFVYFFSCILPFFRTEKGVLLLRVFVRVWFGTEIIFKF